MSKRKITPDDGLSGEPRYVFMAWEDFIWWLQDGPGVIVLICAALIFILGCAASQVIFEIAVEARCTEAGYPNYNVTYAGWRRQGWCIRRVDQTDEVTSVEKLP